MSRGARGRLHWAGRAVAEQGPNDQVQRLLEEDLGRPLYLTPAEVRGGWRELFPELVGQLPTPYPIFAHDEDHVLTVGYPVLMSASLERVRRELDKQLELEVEYRLASSRGGAGDKGKVMAQRERYCRSMAAIMENALTNDYGRRLMALLLLFASGELAAVLGHAPAVVRRLDPDSDRGIGDSLRYVLAGVFADLLQRAAQAAAERLRGLAQTIAAPRLTPLLSVLRHDGLLLTESSLPTDLSQLRGYLRVRFHHDGPSLVAACQRAAGALGELLVLRPDLAAALRMAVGVELEPAQARLLLEPRLLEALGAAGLAAHLGLEDEQVRVLRELGLRLKRLELLLTCRRRVAVVEPSASGPRLAGRTPAVPLALSTRPFDFAAPGVVESSVSRFGLVYDLTSFTAQLEEVRKKGRTEEERALQFMYVFQSQVEEIRRRRRLTFEKFLGDGAFYSSRGALKLIAAACEIQRTYDQLRRSGFPFDRGLRMAMNYGTYRLLPMALGSGEQRFEFFGHGVVELGRLTTGKSTREVEQIAEFLVHSGFDAGAVDAFLAPLVGARSGREEGPSRPYPAWLDGRGELVNEGMVASLPFVLELEREIRDVTPRLALHDGLRWAVLPLEPGGRDSPHVALRYMGVARLKGLQPLELFEARPCDEPPADAPELVEPRGLVVTLRRLNVGFAEAAAAAAGEPGVPEELVVVTYVEPGGERRWVFGEYRPSDDVLLHAIRVTLRPPDLAAGEAFEAWLFAHRAELHRLYEGLRRKVSGVPMPLAGLRQLPGYVGCYLAAPHRSPD